MGMLSLSMFAQTQDKAKATEKKKEPAKVETAKPASATTATMDGKSASKEAKPASKEAKPAKEAKHASKEVAKPAAEKSAETPKK